MADEVQTVPVPVTARACTVTRASCCAPSTRMESGMSISAVGWSTTSWRCTAGRLTAGADEEHDERQDG
jgi:hypothetical protein